MPFVQNMIAFLMGLACVVLAGVVPDVAGALGPAGMLLLSAANPARVLNGSFGKHAATFALGMGCTFVAVMLPRWAPGKPAAAAISGSLLGIGSALATASDFARIVAGLRAQEKGP